MRPTVTCLLLAALLRLQLVTTCHCMHSIGGEAPQELCSQGCRCCLQTAHRISDQESSVPCDPVPHGPCDGCAMCAAEGLVSVTPDAPVEIDCLATLVWRNYAEAEAIVPHSCREAGLFVTTAHSRTSSLLKSGVLLRV